MLTLRDNFNPSMLILAREARGITQKDLAENLGINQGFLSKLESGLRTVSDDLLECISKKLRYPVEFFLQEGKIYGFGPTELFNRRRQSVASKKLQNIHAQINIKRIQLAKILQNVDIIENNIPTFDLEEFNGSVVDVAQTVRSFWRMPPGPINNLAETIEDNGGIILPFDFGTTKIDAISIVVPNLPPLFFINMDSPVDRLRFTLCHELAHVIMHQRDHDSNLESEADQFAAEFLMPGKEIRPFLKNLSINKLIELKIYWKTSMAALLKRASDLKVLDQSKSRSLWVQMGISGYRKNEPYSDMISEETPSLYDEIINTYRDDMNYSLQEFSKLINVFEEDAHKDYYKNYKKLRLVRQ